MQATQLMLPLELINCREVCHEPTVCDEPEAGQDTSPAGGTSVREHFFSTPVETSVQEARQHQYSEAVKRVGWPAEMLTAEMTTAQRFAGAPSRAVMLATWRCPHANCRAVHHYWPKNSQCQRCGDVVEFQPANQAAQTIADWVNS